MLQDMSFGKLENEFRNQQPDRGDFVICISGSCVLIKRDETGALILPKFSAVQKWSEDNRWTSWKNERFRYIFRMQDVDFYLWMGEAGSCEDPDYQYEEVRQLRQMQSKEICFAVMTAWHLYVWYRDNRFCGRCAAPTVHDQAERMMRCPVCGNMIFPRISPAVIVAVTDGDRILLSKYAGRSYTRYALLAGYTEIGETLEETVSREVMEEVGLRVKNIRYYKSQPWGIDGNILMGFYCDLDGDDTIHLDVTELSLAQWFDRRGIPARDDGISLTREMIRVFEEKLEPR
jgi:NAD+ diphosphatase